jgi:hypothetical protein
LRIRHGVIQKEVDAGRVREKYAGRSQSGLSRSVPCRSDP